MIDVGHPFPQATLYEMVDGKPLARSSIDLWGQGHHILFGVPGAFTPTCSQNHVPGFMHAQNELQAHGIHQVFCIAVNDVFVLNAWQKTWPSSSFVRFISDGNGELTRFLGLEMDGTAFGLGMRCQRFALRVQEGIITYRGVEEVPSACTLTHADHLCALLKKA